MRLLIGGARGSIPAPGADFLRHGGDTPCVAVARGGEAVPSLLLDAGTGVRGLGGALGERAFDGAIALTHLHWDHTHGLPFFAGADRDDSRVRVLMPAQDGEPLEVLARGFSPPQFPITPRGLRGRWSFEGLEPGDHAVEGFELLAREVPHRGGRTFGYRVAEQGGDASFAYVPDHDPLERGEGPQRLGAYHDDVRALCEGAALLIHDAHHTREEFLADSSRGHSAMDYAVGLAEECGVPRVLLFHHSPARSDDALDECVAAFADRTVRVQAASQGDEVEIGQPDRG